MTEPDSSDPADFSSTMGDCPACKAQNVKLKNISGLLVCERCAAKRFSSKVRKGIEEAFERQQQRQRVESWKRRMAIAKRGMSQYANSKFNESIRTFHEYLMILERHHGVNAGGLHPRLFDEKKDAGEILIIAGVYWDLAKLYDRIKGRENEMRLALNKYYEFSVGRRHEILSSEALRRYVKSGKCAHKEDFRNTHRLIRANLKACFIASAVYGPESPEVSVLRAFRDRTLVTTPVGRGVITAYYLASPPVARMLSRHRFAAAAMRLILRPVVSLSRAWLGQRSETVL